MEENPSEDMSKKSNAKSFRDKVLKPKHSFSNAQLLSFAAVFAVIGGILLIRSFAFYDPTAAVLYHAEGSLVQSAGDAKIYLVSGNQRRFVTLDDFRSGRFDLNKVVPATPGDEQLPLGPPVSLPAGILVQDQNAKGYYLTDKDASGQIVRRPIDQAAMMALGYDPAKALVGTDLPPAAGSAVSVTSAHPNGTKVSLGRLGTYVIDNGQLRPASADVLSSYKLTKAPALPATRADLALPKGPALGYASGSLLQGSDPSKIYVIDTTGGTPLKRLISDSTVFMSLGYDTKDIHKVADSQLPAVNGLSLPESDNAPITVSANIKPGQDGTSLAKDFRGRSGTTIVSSYKDWVALTLPFKDLAGLKADPRVASVLGSAQAKPAYTNCNDTGSGVAVPCPIIDSFTANPTSVAYGGASTLSWVSEYANNCNINGGGVPTTGSQSTGSLTATAGYTLTCYTAQTSSGTYSVSAGAGVTVGAPPSGGGGGSTGPNYSSTCDAFNVTLRDNINYAGNCLSTSSSQPDLSQITRPGGNWNNAARSIDVKAGLGTTVSLYSATNYGGSCAQYTVDDSDLSTPTTGPTFNLMAASMKVGSACPSTAPPPPTSGCTGTTLANNTPPVVSGTVAVGSTLSSTDGTWCGSGYTLHHYWLDCVDNGPDSRTCKLISGAKSATYTIQASDAGYQLSAEVDVSNSNASASADSAWTAKVPGTITVSLPVNTALPVISGTLMAGTTLQASTGNWSNSPTSYTYLWMRCNPDVATNSSTCTNVTGATSSNIYTLQTADVNSNMKVKVTASNSAGPVAATSNPTGTVQAATTGGGSGGTGSSCDGSSGVYLYSAINYGGNCQKFTSNSAAATTWTVGNDAAKSISFIGNWTATLYQDANYGGTSSMFSLNHPDLSVFDIGNGTTSSITITAGALVAPASLSCTSTSTSAGVYLYASTGYGGACQYFTGSSQSSESWAMRDNNVRSIRIVGGYTAVLYNIANFGGASYTTSVSNSNITGTVVSNTTSSLLVSGTNVPHILYNPTISGANADKTATVGTTLTTSNGTWSASYPQPTSYTYQWYRCTAIDTYGACVPSKETPISGQTGRSYTTQSADANLYVTATVYGKSTAGTGIALSSVIGPIVGSIGPVPVPSIQISGSPQSVVSGSTTVINWTVSGATKCTPTGGTSGWAVQGITLPTGSWKTGAITQNSTFTLNCVNALYATSATNSTTITLCTSNCTSGPPISNLAARSPGLAAIGWTPGGYGTVGEITATDIDTTVGVNVTAAKDVGEQCGTPTGDKSHDNTAARFMGLAGDGINTPAGVDTGLAVKALSFVGDTASMSCAIRQGADLGIKMIEISYAGLKSWYPSGTNFTDCNSTGPTADLLLAVCYAHNKGVTIVAGAGNTQESFNDYIPAGLPYVTAVSGAYEYNGLPPNSSSAANPPKTGDLFKNGSCYTAADDAGISLLAYDVQYSAPLCVWMGDSVPSGSGPFYPGYPTGTSFAAPMAVGVLMRGGSLAGGGAVLPTNGHSYGSEIHL